MILSSKRADYLNSLREKNKAFSFNNSEHYLYLYMYAVPLTTKHLSEGLPRIVESQRTELWREVMQFIKTFVEPTEK